MGKSNLVGVMFKSVLIVSVVLSLFCIGGCKELPMLPSCCDNAPENSYLCEKAKKYNIRLENVDLLLQATAYYALSSSGKAKVLVFLLNIQELLQSETTYKHLQEYILKGVKVAGPGVIIASRYISMLESLLPISDYDKKLLLIHIEHQKMMLKSF